MKVREVIERVSTAQTTVGSAPDIGSQPVPEGYSEHGNCSVGVNGSIPAGGHGVNVDMMAMSAGRAFGRGR